MKEMYYGFQETNPVLLHQHVLEGPLVLGFRDAFEGRRVLELGEERHLLRPGVRRLEMRDSVAFFDAALLEIAEGVLHRQRPLRVGRELLGGALHQRVRP